MARTSKSDLTTRGTKRKTKEEIYDSHESHRSRDHHEELNLCQRLKDGQRTYGDRLSEGFGMIGSD